jgi:aminomethyltransferase
MEKIKKTPLYEEHLKLGAKMSPFAGWEMPIQYESIINEHTTVRTKVGLFDVSHMGEVFVSGAEAVPFLQKLVPQDVSKLPVGKAVYSQLLNNNGGIIDDLIIYRLEDNFEHHQFLLIVNASRINADLTWIEINQVQDSFDVTIENKSDQLAMIAVQGPLAKDLINDLGLVYADQPVRFHIKETSLCGSSVYISRTGYTGEDGFEILVENDKAAHLWQELLSKGQKYEVKPIGLGARDTLRLEAALPLYGQDLNEKTTPVEAALSWSVPKAKNEGYNAKDIIMKQIAGNNIDKILIGFKMLDRSIPRHDYEIYKDGKQAGIVTSGGVAPSIQANIGLGYINTEFQFAAGTTIDIMIREKLHPAVIVNRPFYNR